MKDIMLYWLYGMITELYLKNYIPFDEVTIELKEGLNILTGETGIGKSCIVESLSVLLGNADRRGKSTSSGESRITAGLSEAGVLQLSWTGQERSRTRINGEPASAKELRSALESDVFIASQKHQDRYLKSSFITSILDERTGVVDQTIAHRTLSKQRKEKMKELHRLKDEIERASREKDYLEFTVAEIEKVDPRENEEDDLERKVKKLESQEQVSELTQSLSSTLSGETGILSRIRELKTRYEALLEFEKLPPFDADAVLSSMEEISFHLERSLSAENVPAQLDSLHDRLVAIRRLRKKYGPNIAHVRETLEKNRARLAITEDGDFEIKDIENQLDAIEKDITRLAGKIEKARLGEAGKFLKDLRALSEKLALKPVYTLRALDGESPRTLELYWKQKNLPEAPVST